MGADILKNVRMYRKIRMVRFSQITSVEEWVRSWEYLVYNRKDLGQIYFVHLKNTQGTHTINQQ